MLEIELLENVLDNLYYPIYEGFESTIFMSEYDNIAKIYKAHVPYEMLFRKEHILIPIHFSKIYTDYDILPKIYKLIYNSKGIFVGYIMVPLSGERLDEFCINAPISDRLFVLKTLQKNMQIINNNGFALTDFNPGNFLVSKDHTVRFIDVDNFAFINESRKRVFCNYRYVCPYSKVVDRKYNLYSYYALALDMLLNVNLKDSKKSSIIQTITDNKILPKDIKDKLIYFVKIHNKRQLQQLENLF
jgi:hypothetical protein